MPNLSASLRDQDLGFISIIASFWRISIERTDVSAARQSLVDQMLDPELVEEVVAALPSEASDALTAILRNTGRFPWTRYVQQHGDIRQVGRAKRDRERPYENNPSAVEMLYYRGLVARAFMDTTDGPLEFAYIPDDLLPLIPFSSPALEEPFGRPASDKECEFICPSNDHILDDAATMLAGLRSDHDFSRDIPEPYSQFLLELLKTAGLVEDDGKLDIDTTRLFLEKPRGDALAALCRAWIKSARLNDLRTMPAVIAEGEWQNDPLRTRQTVLDMVQSVPESTWWSLPAFIAAVKDRHPEFQRPDGDFESWFLKDSSSGDYLWGIDHWDEVEGALIRWLITGPLFWLGIVDLASWQPARPADVLYSNATLHWLGDHGRLFPALFSGLAPRGVLAVQMPRNFAAPSHTAVAEAARRGPWRTQLEPLLRPPPVAEPAFYFDLLAPRAAAVDIWETEYVHVLEGEHPVTEWVKGTWLRPLLDALDEPDRSRFEGCYAELVARAYPRRPDGRTLLPFRRLFIVATAAEAS